jgi:hypothetical protein
MLEQDLEPWARRPGGVNMLVNVPANMAGEYRWPIWLGQHGRVNVAGSNITGRAGAGVSFRGARAEASVGEPRAGEAELERPN